MRSKDTIPYMKPFAKISSERFVLRQLTEGDASERYLGWFKDNELQKYIEAAKQTFRISDLKAFIRERSGKVDVLFLGIFDKTSGLHVGNLKYEPINSDAGYAVMGILIGDPAYRGKGIMKEVIWASARWLQEHRQIDQILLGVKQQHQAAIRAYERAGFEIADTPYIPEPLPGAVTMVLSLQDRHL